MPSASLNQSLTAMHHSLILNKKQKMNTYIKCRMHSVTVFGTLDVLRYDSLDVIRYWLTEPVVPQRETVECHGLPLDAGSLLVSQPVPHLVPLDSEGMINPGNRLRSHIAENSEAGWRQIKEYLGSFPACNSFRDSVLSSAGFNCLDVRDVDGEGDVTGQLRRYQ